jgi:hypothetical protein
MTAMHSETADHSDERLAQAAARLGVPPRRLDAALDAVAAGRSRARLRDAGRRHSAVTALSAALGRPC